MRMLDASIALAVGFAGAVYTIWIADHPAGVAEPFFASWPLAVVMLAIGLLLGPRHASTVSRLVGGFGLGWVAYLVSAIALTLAFVPQGY